MSTRVKLPTVNDLSRLVSAVKRDIGDDYRAFEGDEDPGIQLTIGWTARDGWAGGVERRAGEWSYQTGDNSYTGGAYGHPHWAVVGVYRTANVRDVVADIRRQLLEVSEYDRE
jgi:hypothetical protein